MRRVCLVSETRRGKWTYNLFVDFPPQSYSYMCSCFFIIYAFFNNVSVLFLFYLCFFSVWAAQYTQICSSALLFAFLKTCSAHTLWSYEMWFFSLIYFFLLLFLVFVFCPGIQPLNFHCCILGLQHVSFYSLTESRM